MVTNFPAVLADTDSLSTQILNIKQLTDILVSPNDEFILIEMKQPEINEKEPDKSKWKDLTKILSLKDGKSSDLPCSLTIPQWSADSKWITYLDAGNFKRSLWATPRNQFKPQKILELDEDIYAYKFSIDGKKIAVAVVATPQSESDKTRIVYSEDSQGLYLPCIFDVDEDLKIDSRSFTSLSSPVPFSGSFTLPNFLFAWSPNNRDLALLSQSQMKASTPQQNTQISVINTTNGKIFSTTDEKGIAITPIFSPDGKWMAYKTNIFPKKPHVDIAIFNVGPTRICIQDTETHEKKCLASTFNENPTIVGWMADSQSIVVAEDYKMASQLYSLPINGKEGSPLLKDASQVISSGLLNSDTNSIFYVGETLRNPQELFSLNIKNANFQQISHFQEPTSLTNYSAEVISWPSKDGKKIEGMLMLPTDPQEKGGHPLLVILHDGPALGWKKKYLGSLWEPYLNISQLLKKGYAILAPNYRGSTGYGLAFRQANYKDLGGGDFKDVMTGIDYLIKKGIVDSQRIGIWGWGYGGYLSSWAITQTNRFKTAIVGAGVTDWISYVGQTTYPDLWEAYFGGYYWDNYEEWMERSPSFKMHNVKTPTLIQWGYEDNLFHWVQAFELDYSLSDNNLPHTLLWYFNEGHSFNNPYNINKASQDLIKWLKEYLPSNEIPKGQ